MTTREELNKMVEFVKAKIVVDKTKEGDIKIDIECVRWLLYYMEELQNIVSNNLQILDDKEQIILEKSLDLYNYVWASTIGIGALRQMQVTFFEGFKKLDDYTNEEAAKEGINLEELRTSYLAEYVEAKNNRETLAIMLKKLSNDFEYFRVSN